MTNPLVAIFMGSLSDKEKVLPTTNILEKLGIPYIITVTSAHRTPERTCQLVNSLEAEGCQVFICAAGMAAHLAGAVAAQTIRPVLGVPLATSPLSGMDSLLATVQMPPGFPVGTMALDQAGATNAAWLAAQILALQDKKIEKRIEEQRAAMRKKVELSAKELKKISTT